MIHVCFSEIQTTKTAADSLYFSVHKTYSAECSLHARPSSPRRRRGLALPCCAPRRGFTASTAGSPAAAQVCICPTAGARSEGRSLPPVGESSLSPFLCMRAGSEPGTLYEGVGVWLEERECPSG